MRKKKFFEKVKVSDLGSKGNSICKTVDGQVLIVKNGVPGDVVDVVTYKKRKNYFLGNIKNYHELSKERIQPKCSHFGICGGCKWQNINYDAQVKFKENKLRYLFKTFEVDKKFDKIIKVENQFYYRNKLEFSFTNNRWLTENEINSTVEIKEKRGLGFHPTGMWNKVVDIDKCFLQSDPSNRIRNSVKTFAINNNISFYNPKLHTGILRTLMIRNNNAGEFMVIVQFLENNKMIIDLLLNFLKNSFKEIKSLNYIINKKVNDSIYDQKIINYSGEKSIDEKITNLRFKINPKSFFQTNTNQTLNLYKVVRKFAKLSGNELVYDLYCGLGTISQFLADNSKKIIGIESVEDAICSARKSVSANKINNVEFVVGDMRKVLNGGLFSKYGRPDLLITDPPRDGMHKDVIKQILKILPKKIIYVSCNPATQKRDLDLLLNHFKISKIQPVDMFPHTDHVENVVLLKLKNKFSCTN